MKAHSLFGGRLKINLLMIPAVLALVLLGMGDIVLCYIPALFLHEWAHVITAAAFGMTITQMELFPFGCAARMQCFAVSRSKELIVAAAGPAANMAAASAVYFINKYGFAISIADKLIAANLALAAVNMLPALPLDGGRIARSLFASFLGYKRATRLTAAAGIFFSAVMLAVGIVAAASGAFNPTIFIMAFFLCLAAIKELKTAPYTLIRDFSGKRTSIEKRKTLNINRFAAMQSQTLNEIMREFEAGKYNIVTVLDKNLGVARDLSEQQILYGMMQYGSQVTLGSLCRKLNK
ncbi:MAG: site-2 protease family protein [Christensenellales bacterium]